MSEKLYAWFLRLYPAHFRNDYGDEALQLFRDRASNERGFFPRLRLWFDLFFDLTVSLPREYLHVPSPRVAAPAPPRLQGLPGFYVFQNQAPRPAALLIGSMLSVAILGSCWNSLNTIHRSDGSGASGFSSSFASSHF